MLFTDERIGTGEEAPSTPNCLLSWIEQITLASTAGVAGTE